MSDTHVRQFLGVLRIELAKTLFGRRALPLWLFALIPIGISLLSLIVSTVWDPKEGGVSLADSVMAFALIFQVLVRGLLFLGCAWIFTSLFRGEILDRSLHYYFLAPIRRELLTLGKFVAGWIGSTTLFVTSGLVCQGLLFGALGPSAALDHLLHGAGLLHWISYAFVTALACMGYGAVFLLAGLRFKNPLVPAVVVFLWETTNPLLPALLKKLSVIFYLQALLPVRPEGAEGPFALLADPVSPWLAIPGLFLFTAAMLFLATRRALALEIAYAGD